MGLIDKDSDKPRYLQLKESIVEKIVTGQYKAGDKIPPEVELARDYQVSRSTVRQALKELAEEGYIDRQKRKGTFVKNTKLEKETRLIVLAPDRHADLIVRPLARLFSKRHPEIAVNVIGAPYESIHEHFHIEFIQHSGSVDVIMVPYSMMPEYVLSGKLEMLDLYIDKAGLDFTTDYLKDSGGRPVIEKTCTFDIPGVGIKIFGIPFQNDVYVLVYRKDLFEKYGLEPPKTAEEYLAIAKKLTGAKAPDGRIVPYGTALSAKRTGADLAEDFIGFLWMFGGKLFDEEFVPIINSPAGRRALNFYKLLLQFAPPESLDRSVFDNVRVMRNGDVAMMLNWSSLIGSLEDPNLSNVAGKLGYALFPPQCPQVAGWELGINYDSTHKQESFEFIKFVTSSDKEVTSIYRERGVLPYRLSILRDPEVLRSLRCASIVEEAWRKGRAWGRFRENRALMEVISLYGSYFLKDIISAEEALQKISESFKTLVQKDAVFRRLSNGEKLRRLA